MGSPKYKLMYFNSMGITEPIRLLFALVHEPFEDFRIPREEWESTKKSMPWGCIPVLEWKDEDGKTEQLSQSFAILRFLGRKFNRAGTNEVEMAKCEEIIEAMADVVRESVKMYFEKDAIRKEEITKRLKEEIWPAFAPKISAILKENGNGVLVGKEATIADLYVAHMMSRTQNEDGLILYPEICIHRDYILNLGGIKEYIAKRPVTLM